METNNIKTIYKLIIVIQCLLTPLFSTGQCTNVIHDFNFTFDVSSLTVGVRTSMFSCFWSGERITISNMSGGSTYKFDVCGNTSYDSHLTIVEDNTINVLAWDDNSCVGDDDAELDFVPSSSGAYDLLLHQMPGCLTNAQCTNIFVTLVTLLPVELTSFKAEFTDADVKLYWVTGSEINSHGFEIQRSSDPSKKKWETLDFITSKGGPDQVTNYSFDDKTPFVGLNYYRLKMVDIDGSFEFSKVLVVNNNQKLSGEILLFPNPILSDRILKIDLIKKGKGEIKILDINGVVRDRQIARFEGHPIDFELANLGLKKGIYIIQLSIDGFYWQEKLFLL